MHEMSLCASVLRVLEAEAPVHGFERVNRVRLEIGALAGVEVEALRFGFEVAKAGTIAARATLQIDRLPGTAWCEGCAREVEVGTRLDPCPRCGCGPLRVTGGDEMRIKDLEVE